MNIPKHSDKKIEFYVVANKIINNVNIKAKLFLSERRDIHFISKCRAT
jgi:hypothetical protein